MHVNYRRDPPKLFFEPAAAIAVLLLTRAAKETKTEISCVFTTVPYSLEHGLQPHTPGVPYMINDKYPDLIVLSGEFPDQKCTSIETLFEVGNVDAKLKVQLADAYPDVNIEGSSKTWFHNHPGGVNPSTTDEENVKDKIGMSMYYVMIIINSTFSTGMNPTDIYARLILNTSSIQPALEINPQTNKFEWDGKSIRFSNDGLIKTVSLLSHGETKDFIIEGHYPIYWKTYNRTVYNDIMSNTPCKDGYEIWNNIEETQAKILLPSVSQICSRVKNSYTNNIGFQQQGGKKKGGYGDFDSFNELLDQYGDDGKQGKYKGYDTRFLK